MSSPEKPHAFRHEVGHTLVFMTHHPELQGAPIVVELDHETLIWFSTLKENPAMRNSSLQPQQLECTLQIQSASLNEMLSLPAPVTFPAVLLVEYTEQIWLHLTVKDPTTFELYKKGSGWKVHGLEPWDAEPGPPVGWRC